MAAPGIVLGRSFRLVSSIPRSKFAAAAPRSTSIILSQARHNSTLAQLRLPRPATPLIRTFKPQHRTLFGSAVPSQNLLAQLEETANRNPTSATAQNAFYQALLRANMPAIIIERHQSGAFATNTSTEAAYQKALSSGGHIGGQVGGQAGNFNDAQMQAMAIAAGSRGGNMARTVGNGGKDGSLHVVVEETIGHSIFKWVKLIAYFGLFTYLSLVIVAMLIETLQSFKKIGGKTDNEAKAEHQTVRFSDVHGCDEAKDELQELVEFLKDPEKFTTLGGKLPKGVLLVGPPGTGKTLLARAVAGESGVPFFYMSGSEFDEIYVGVGAKRVRELFAAAKGKSPAIVFIDELDAIGGKRNSRDAAYVKQTLNQLLTELDGFEQNSGVIILAATNFPELLDKALTRPGRFDRNVVVGLPDVRGRIAILKHHMTKIIADKSVSLEALAKGTPGFSGADLENIINQAAVHASRAKSAAVTMLDLEWAKDKVMMGAEKKSMVITQKEREMTAYHEAGHALVGMFTPRATPLYKITIMPRGQTLGVTYHLPEMDKHSMSMDEYQAHLAVCMGGKVAEELVYGPDKVTSGVSGDLQSATQTAYAMVTRMGMSPRLGNVDLASNYDALSSETKKLIEVEVRRMIEDGRIHAETLLKEKSKELHLLAKALVDYETLNREEAFKVIKGEKLEGRIVTPAGNIKVPQVSNELPEIPGSTGQDNSNPHPPPPAVAG